MSDKCCSNNQEKILVTPNAAIDLYHQKISEHSNWYLALGVLLIILGTIALGSSVFTTVISTVILGGYIIAAGVLHLIHAFKLKSWGYFFLHLFMGILYAISGGFIIHNPLINAVFLTLYLAIFFIISGAFKAAYALTSSPTHRGLLFFSGFINVILGILIYKQWPYSGLWVLGAFVGIDLIMTGWTWVLLSLKSKQAINENYIRDNQNNQTK